MRKFVVMLICIFVGLGVLITYGRYTYPTAGTGQLHFTASPSTQGVGGTALLTLSAKFGGWCGVSVYSPFMEAQLNLPPGLALVEGSEKVILPEVAVPPGKERSTEVSWLVRILEPGDYNVTVNVTGNYDQRFKVKRDARQEVCQISAKAAPIVGLPVSNNNFPNPNSDIEIRTKINSNSPITDARLHYTVEPKGIDAEVLMKKLDETDYWAATIPKQDHNSQVKYLFAVSDEQGRRLETSQFGYAVLDPVKVNEWPRILIWSFTTLSAIILLVYLLYRAKLIGKLFKNPQIGVLPMGVDLVNEKAIENGSSAEKLDQICKTRQRYFLAYLALAIIFVLIGIYNNQFVDVAKRYW